MIEMTRWVKREGRVVEFGNIVGSFVGKAYVYKFPSEALAKKFERFMNSTTNGHPSPVPEEWQKYQAGTRHPFDPPASPGRGQNRRRKGP